MKDNLRWTNVIPSSQAKKCEKKLLRNNANSVPDTNTGNPVASPCITSTPAKTPHCKKPPVGRNWRKAPIFGLLEEAVVLEP